MEKKQILTMNPFNNQNGKLKLPKMFIFYCWALKNKDLFIYLFILKEP